MRRARAALIRYVLEPLGFALLLVALAGVLLVYVIACGGALAPHG